MGLTIKLATPDKANWQPGDVIAGQVCLDASSEVHVSQISIHLSGLVNNVIIYGLVYTGENNFYSKWSLFNEETTLFQGPYSLKPDTYNWPFHFTIPMETQLTSKDTPFPEHVAPFNPLLTQPLPPTIQTESKQGQTSGNRYTIAYSLTANLVPSKASVLSSRAYGGSMEASLPIVLLPHRHLRSPAWDMRLKRCLFTCRSLHLNSEIQRSLSLKQRMQTSFRRSSLPLATFSLLARLPRVAAVDQPLPLYLLLSHDLDASTTRGPPMVSLVSLTASLAAHNTVRAIRTGNRIDFFTGTVQNEWTDEYALAAPFKPSPSLPLPEILDLRQYIRLQAPAACVPSFNTINVARHYTLRLRITLECARERFRAAFDVPDFSLLGPYPEQAEAPPTFDEAAAQAATRTDSVDDVAAAAPIAADAEPDSDADALAHWANVPPLEDLPAYGHHERY